MNSLSWRGKKINTPNPQELLHSPWFPHYQHLSQQANIELPRLTKNHQDCCTIVGGLIFGCTCVH